MIFLLSVRCLAVMMLVGLTLVSGAKQCLNTLDCAKMDLAGYICQHSRCVCDPNTDTGLFPCRGGMYGDRCRENYECEDQMNLVCLRHEQKCACRRGFLWNEITKVCYRIKEFPYDNSNKGFDPVREIVVLGFVVIAIGAFIYMGLKVFCSCGKFWKRRQRHLTREMDEVPHQQQDTWVASYRVFSSLNGMETRSSPGLSPSSSFPLHPTPCMGLFLPSSSLAAAAAASTTASTMPPPSYEEALKHKVILSSFPSATTVILPTAPPIQSPPNNMPGGTFMCSSQGGPN